ncbi:MAG: GGDEF domain-containing protein, partial [Oscillospiraceae bacterium]|nr:GGDEF domain-containing protein [Oscillospiraceae bacterium]
MKELGYWSNFSSLTHNSAGSIKYTVPLIAEDGTVYGVLGIGLTEKSVLANLPANDFISESACYVLCRRKSLDDAFEICMHSGIAFNRLIGTETELCVLEQLDSNVYDFDLPSHISSVGSIQYMNLYNSNSVHSPEDWAIISVAERADVLQVFTNLISMLLLAALISVAVSVLVVFISSSMFVKPISAVIDTMNAKQEYTKVIQFRPTNIYELDKLTDAIMQLQKNAQDFSSQVSKMLRIANVGLCTFMYDPMDDSMFVGQSMLKLLHLSEEQEGDIVISRELFLENIIAPETKDVITKCLAKRLEIAETTGFSKEYSIAHEHNAVTWMRLSVVGSQNKMIGVLQDITGAVLEKQRIEYERDYDSTTGLLNRHAYYRKVSALFSDPEQLKVTAFIMIDLDNLKYVNDTYGHDFGDDYIRTAATMLKSFEAYHGIVARLSG